MKLFFWLLFFFTITTPQFQTSNAQVLEMCGSCDGGFISTCLDGLGFCSSTKMFGRYCDFNTCPKLEFTPQERKEAIIDAVVTVVTTIVPIPSLNFLKPLFKPIISKLAQTAVGRGIKTGVNAVKGVADNVGTTAKNAADDAAKAAKAATVSAMQTLVRVKDSLRQIVPKFKEYESGVRSVIGRMKQTMGNNHVFLQQVSKKMDDTRSSFEGVFAKSNVKEIQDTSRVVVVDVLAISDNLVQLDRVHINLKDLSKMLNELGDADAVKQLAKSFKESEMAANKLVGQPNYLNNYIKTADNTVRNFADKFMKPKIATYSAQVAKLPKESHRFITPWFKLMQASMKFNNYDGLARCIQNVNSKIAAYASRGNKFLSEFVRKLSKQSDKEFVAAQAMGSAKCVGRLTKRNLGVCDAFDARTISQLSQEAKNLVGDYRVLQRGFKSLSEGVNNGFMKLVGDERLWIEKGFQGLTATQNMIKNTIGKTPEVASKTVEHTRAAMSDLRKLLDDLCGKARRAGARPIAPGMRWTLDGKELEAISQLGEGSRGIMWKVRSVADNKIYALKEFKLNPGGTGHMTPEQIYEQTLELFVNEASTLNKLGRLHAADDIGKQFYILTDLVKGLDLHQVLTKLRQAGETSGAFVDALKKAYLDGLKKVHNRGIAHRDLFPGNAMIEGVEINSAGKLVRTGEVKGTMIDFEMSETVSEATRGVLKTEIDQATRMFDTYIKEGKYPKFAKSVM